ncbi:MAG: purine-binding chemotaxis protein CheW [Candidatus Sericytochromatia bacterium]|nr:purine-binding chemotaxis protein CheW [Candidatus Sericytochromatia bacterium]
MNIEDKEKILKQRASEISLVYNQEDKDDYIDILEFTINNDKYAVESKFIDEVYLIKDITEIPFTPSYIIGVISVRGNIFSVIDIKRLFNQQSQEVKSKSKAIILKNNDMEFALLSESVIGITRLKRNDIQTKPFSLTGLQAEYILGMTTEKLVILDADKMLSDKKMIINQEV